MWHNPDLQMLRQGWQIVNSHLQKCTNVLINVTSLITTMCRALLIRRRRELSRSCRKSIYLYLQQTLRNKFDLHFAGHRDRFIWNMMSTLVLWEELHSPCAAMYERHLIQKIHDNSHQVGSTSKTRHKLKCEWQVLHTNIHLIE